MTLPDLMDAILPALIGATIIGQIAFYVRTERRFSKLETMGEVNAATLKERRALADAHETKISGLEKASNELRLQVVTALADLRQEHIRDHAEVKGTLEAIHRELQHRNPGQRIHES